MLRKFFNQKIGVPARRRGWRLGEKFGRFVLPGALLLPSMFKSVKNKANRWPCLTVSLLLSLIIVNTTLVIHYSFQTMRRANRSGEKTLVPAMIKPARAPNMAVLIQPMPDINRLKSIRDSLQLFKEKKVFTPQDTTTILQLLKEVALFYRPSQYP